MHAVTPTGHVLAGRYELMTPVGHGAMGTVWRAWDPVLAREVAVKEVSLPDAITEQDRAVLRERTLREARAAAKLNHPGVITVYDVIETDGNPWIVMELVTARSLDQILAQEGPLPPQRAAEMGVMLLEALASAHSAGIVHRDVKPANVLLTPAGRVVLTDFGLATCDGDPALTQVGVIMGTPGFCAPERIRGEPASPASDLWSLGATLYAAVEGRGPFHGAGSPMAVLATIVNSEPPAPRSAGPLGAVINSLLGRDPSQRPDAASAGRMLAGLAPSALVGAPATATSATSLGAVPASPVGIGRPVAVTPAAPGPHDLSRSPHEAMAGVTRVASRDATARPGPPAHHAQWARRSPLPATAAPVSRVTVTSPLPALVFGEEEALSGHPRRSPSPATGRRAHAAGPDGPGGQSGHRQPRARRFKGLPRTRRGLLFTVVGSAAIVGAAVLVLIATTGRPAGGGRVKAVHHARRTQTALPPGYYWYSGTNTSAVTAPGFSIAVPDGWQTYQRGTITSLRDPVTGGSITITPLASGGGPLQQVRALQRATLRHGRPRGYHQIAIGLFAFRGRLGGMWRFRYRSPGAGTTDALDVVARVGDQEYELSVASPAPDWPSTSHVFGKVLRTFTPHPS